MQQQQQQQQQQGPPPPHFQGRGPGGPPPPALGGPPPGQQPHYPPPRPPHVIPGGPPPPGAMPPYGIPPPQGGPLPPPGAGHPGGMIPVPGQQQQQQPPPHLHHQQLHHRMPPPPRPGFGPGPPPPSLPGSVGMVGPYGGVVPPMPVPIMPGMKPGMPPVGLGSSNALLTGLPNSGGAVAGQGGAMAGVVVGGALPDKMNTLFIGSIAPGINKVAMEKLLRTTGNLIKWKHVQDPTTQKWKAFGFAEYADADSLLRTLRVLGQDGQQPKGEKPVGLELKAMDGSDVVKALLVKADEKTRQFLDQYEESRPRTIHDTEKDKVALANATKIIQQMKDGTLDTTDTTSGSDDTTTTEPSASSSNKDDITLTGRPRRRDNLDGAGKTGEDGTEEEMSEEQKELIAREINFFRERAALKEKERKEEEERSERMARSGQHHRLSKDGSAATGANAS
ncbi:hypothetical protein BGZ97_007678, partial [Linnemannia gamsii]